MAKILSYLGRYVCVGDPLKTIEVFRGYESITVSISDIGDTSLEPVMRKIDQDFFDEEVWTQCSNGVEIDFRRNGLILKKPNGDQIEYRKK